MKCKPLILMATVCLNMAGCASQWDARQEISSARLNAYHQWGQRQKTSDEEEPHIDGRLSLEDALKLALTHNKELQAVAQERDIARGRVMSSYNGLLPTVSLLGSYTRYDDDAYDKNCIGSLNEYSADIKVTQPIFRGGATEAELRSAQLLACYSDERIRQQVETTLYRVTSNYYRVLLAQHLLKVTQDAVASAGAYLDEVTRKRNNGLANDYNVLRARVDVALYQAQMIQQRNTLNLATTQLLKEMGVHQDSRIDLSGSLVYRSMQPVFEKAVETAYRNRPDLGQAHASVRMSEEAVRLAASRYGPQISAFAAGGWGRPDPYERTRDEWDSHAFAGVYFELLDTQERTVLEIRQAILSLRDAEKFVESQRMNLQLANEGLRLAEVGYRNGINTEIDVTDARSALTRAMGLHYQAVYDHAIARLMLQKACGILAQAEQGNGNMGDETQCSQRARQQPTPTTVTAAESTSSPASVHGDGLTDVTTTLQEAGEQP